MEILCCLEEDINSAIEEENKEKLNSLLESGKDKINLFMAPIDFGGKLANKFET